MTEISLPLPRVMADKAVALRTGRILFAYKDGTAIRMETEDGLDTYVWRRGEWRPMRVRPRKRR